MTVDAEHCTPLTYGRLDKFTAVKELTAKGFVVPPVFSTVEEAIDWQQSGGEVIARPYFDAPWDSAIFLPGLNSYVLDEDCTDTDLQQFIWQEYIRDLYDNHNLLGYLEEFGVNLTQPPKVSFFLQALVNRGKLRYYEPSRANIVMMDNEDNTHIEWKESHVRTSSGVYKKGKHVMWERFNGFGSSITDNGELSGEELTATYQQVKNKFSDDKNLQVEFSFGQLQEGGDAELFVVQVRDFPQLPSKLWEYDEEIRTADMGSISLNFLRDYFQLDELGRFSSINDISQFEDPSYVLHIDANGWADENFINTFQGMKGLWIHDRYAKVPLMHGLFSLIELAHIRGGKVLLG